MPRLLVILLCVIVSPLAASAQPLAGRVRADAVFYLGWAGGSSMGPGYEGSHLKAIVDASNFDALTSKFLPQALDRIIATDPASLAPVRQILLDVVAPMWRYPTAMYLGPVEMAADGKPMPKAALICQAGRQGTIMSKRLADLVAKAPKDAPPMRAALVGDLVVVSIGFEKASAAVAGGAGTGGASLADDAGYRAVLAGVHRESVMALFIDVASVLKQVDGAMQRFAEPPVREQWTKARDASGLAGLKRVMLTEAFEGKDWGSRAFVEAPGPRKGLLTVLDGEPLTDGSLAAIPRTATMAGVGRFDFAKFFSAVRTGIHEANEDAGKQVDQGIESVNGILGFDVEHDLFAAFGDEWTYYMDPLGGGKSFAGFTLVNRLREPAKADASLARLQQLLNGIVAQQMKDAPVRITLKQTAVNGLTIHYLAVPLVSPAWAIADGNMYFGLYPQTVAVAAEHVRTKAPSILQNEAFVAARKAVGGSNGASIQFVDLLHTAPDAYPGLVMLSRLLGVGDLFGIETPAIVGPSLKTLMQHLAPVVTVTWSDDKGWYAHTRQPFPGSSILASDPLGGGLGSLQALPAIAEMMKDAKRTR